MLNYEYKEWLHVNFHQAYKSLGPILAQTTSNSLTFSIPAINIRQQAMHFSSELG